MTLDVRGSLKNTRLSKRRYVVLDELVSNSIDSYLIRKSVSRDVEKLEVHIHCEFYKPNPTEDVHDLKLSCKDNGFGMGREQVKAFVTKDTSFKDDLKVDGLGKCKGTGRIQFLHHFKKLEIDSVFTEEGVLQRRTLKAESSQKEINASDFTLVEDKDALVSTTITLDAVREQSFRMYFGDIFDLEFSPSRLKEYVLLTHLQRFISLQEMLGDFYIIFSSNLHPEQRLISDNLPPIEEVVISHVSLSVVI